MTGNEKTTGTKKQEKEQGEYAHWSLPSLLPLSEKIDKALMNSENCISLSLFSSKICITRSNNGFTEHVRKRKWHVYQQALECSWTRQSLTFPTRQCPTFWSGGAASSALFQRLVKMSVSTQNLPVQFDMSFMSSISSGERFVSTLPMVLWGCGVPSQKICVALAPLSGRNELIEVLESQDTAHMVQKVGGASTCGSMASEKNAGIDHWPYNEEVASTTNVTHYWTLLFATVNDMMSKDIAFLCHTNRWKIF